MALLLVLSAFFSGSETALFSISSIQKDRMKRKGSKAGRRILSLLENPRRLIVTILMGNEFVNITLSAISAALFAQLLPGNRWAPVLILTIILLLVGEITPKSIAISRPMIYARTVALPLQAFTFLIFPIRWIVEKVVGILVYLSKVKDIETGSITESELRLLTVVGVEEGEFEKDEAEMILRVFDLDDTPVQQMMTPRTEVIALSSDADIDEALDIIRTHRVSRLPVYDESIDNIIGILHANDLLRHRLQGRALPVGKITRPTFFVPESMKADDLLRRFRSHRLQQAIVLDEFGGTAGLVTIDDLLGELFGELSAERADDDFSYRECENGDWIVAGAMDLDDFGKLTHTDFSTVPMETAGGMVFHQFGHLPSQGDMILIGKFRFTILTIRDNRVWRLRVRKGGGV
jgi:CBS domain containing-hemolysin-like protein